MMLMLMYVIINIKEISYDRIVKLEQEEILIIYFKNKISSETGKLTIEFDGVLNETLQGFYKTKCVNRDGTLGKAFNILL